MTVGLLSSSFPGDGLTVLKKIELAKKMCDIEDSSDDVNDECDSDALEVLNSVSLRTENLDARKKHYFNFQFSRFTSGHWNITTPPPKV